MTENRPAESMRLLLLIGAKNEETQLEKTVRGLQAACSPETAAGMVILLARTATEGCVRTARALQGNAFPIPVETVQQPTDDIPASINAVLGDGRDASHILCLASDYFVESSAIADLIARAEQDRGAIYKLSRALPGGSFSPHYRAGMVPLYRLFCVFIRALYMCGITDPSFTVMVVPVRLFQSIRFRRTSLAFLLEWMYALLRAKIPIVEIPAVNLPRTEGENSTNLAARLRHAAIAVRTRVVPAKKLWKEGYTP